MARIELAPEVTSDFQRIIAHLHAHDAAHATGRIDSIVSAIDVLQSSPLIGRPCGNGLRELVIGRGTHGFLALYRYFQAVDTVVVLAVRSQREAGYTAETDRP